MIISQVMINGLTHSPHVQCDIRSVIRFIHPRANAKRERVETRLFYTPNCIFGTWRAMLHSINVVENMGFMGPHCPVICGYHIKATVWNVRILLCYVRGPPFGAQVNGICYGCARELLFCPMDTSTSNLSEMLIGNHGMY